MKIKTRPFSMYRKFTTSVYCKPTLVEFMHILRAFHHLPISLLVSTHFLIDPFSMYRKFTTSVYCKPTLVEFMHILRAFHHLPISLLVSTHFLIDAFRYAQVELNYKLNYFILKHFLRKWLP